MWARMHGHWPVARSASPRSTPFTIATRRRKVFVSTHVDDCMILGEHEYARQATKAIKSMYTVRDNGFPDVFLGVEYKRTKEYIEICNTAMIDALMKRFRIASKLVTSPMPADTQLTAEDHSATRPDSTEYRQMVGSINFIAGRSRPDCAYIAHALARHLNAPTHAHYNIARRTIQYMHSTRTLGIRYYADHTHDLISYSDSDWAGCIDTRQSTSGRVHIMQGAAVMWATQRQKSIALSSAEAEMVALSEAARDVRFIRRFLKTIGQPLTNPTPVYEDNASALKWATSAASPKWNATRHIATRHFAVRVWRDAGIVDIRKVSTHKQLADPFTKALPHAQLAALRASVHGVRRADAPGYNPDLFTFNHAAASA